MEKIVDLAVRELKRYNVKVAGLQETKWLGCDVYDVVGSVMLIEEDLYQMQLIASREVKE